MSELGEKPIFGSPPEKKVRLAEAKSKGQKTLGFERQLSKARLPELSIEAISNNKIKERRRLEKSRINWDEYVFNEGTRDEFKRLGRYYTIDEGVEALGLFNIPPRTGEAVRMGSLVSGDKVFMIKDSEKAEDRVRKGWAEIMVLESIQGSDKLKPRMFNDGLVNRVICRVWHQGVIDRQIVL